MCKFLLESIGSGTGTPELLYYVTSAWKSVAVCGSLPVSNIVKVSVKQYVTVDKFSKMAGVVMLLTRIWTVPTSNLDQDISHPEFGCDFYQSISLILPHFFNLLPLF